MKDFAANILFAASLVVVVIVWYSFSNNFSGTLSAKPELIPSVAVVSKTLTPEENFLRSGYCKDQHVELLEETSHAAMVAARKNNPEKYDQKCFDFPGLSDVTVVGNCLVGDKKKRFRPVR